jgi:hypothetical protein
MRREVVGAVAAYERRDGRMGKAVSASSVHAESGERRESFEPFFFFFFFFFCFNRRVHFELTAMVGAIVGRVEKIKRWMRGWRSGRSESLVLMRGGGGSAV